MRFINIYLNFEGTTEAAFNFYKSVFGGEFVMISKYKDMPGAEKIKAADKDKILHISLPLGKTQTTLMGSDLIEGFGPKLKMGNNAHIMIQAESEAEANRLFAVLSVGGRAVMPLQRTFWGALYGSCTDKFGANWMINYDYPKQD